MAKLLQKSYWPKTAIEGHEAYMAEEDKRDKEFEQLWANHEKAREAGEVEGQIYSHPIADGAAYYLVTKAKPLTLCWINVGDCWQAPYPLIRGLRVADINW